VKLGGAWPTRWCSALTKTANPILRSFSNFSPRELLTKIPVGGFVAAVEDDRKSHRYLLMHTLVRADGIGEWPNALDDMLAGPAARHLAKVRPQTTSHPRHQDLENPAMRKRIVGFLLFPYEVPVPFSVGRFAWRP
jgi:hypothetical protein